MFIFRNSTLILIGLFLLCFGMVNAQSKVYKAEDIVKDKLEVIRIYNISFKL